MEAQEKKIASHQLLIGGNHRVRIMDSPCMVLIEAMTQLRRCDLVQIYPTTVNAYFSKPEPKTVAVRKIEDGNVRGRFIVLPLTCLDLNDKQMSLLFKFNSMLGVNDPHLAYVSTSNCCHIAKDDRLEDGDKVKYYPYSMDLFIDEKQGAYNVSNPIMIAVRKVEKKVIKGDFILVPVDSLHLNSSQKEGLQEIIEYPLLEFVRAETLSQKSSKFLFKKLRKQILFLSEQDILELVEEFES